jgi:hypothetical protein
MEGKKGRGKERAEIQRGFRKLGLGGGGGGVSEREPKRRTVRYLEAVEYVTHILRRHPPTCFRGEKEGPRGEEDWVICGMGVAVVYVSGVNKHNM